MSNPNSLKSSDKDSALQSDASERSDRSTLWLCISGLVSWWLYVSLVWLSRGFSYETPGPEHPLVPALAILAAAFALYLIQVTLVIRGRVGKATLPMVVVFAIAFRVLLLFSEPIQEVDAYRYLWDGKVAAAGVNPFQYSPHQVLAADSFGINPADFKCLVALRDRSPANAEILSRVHFGELTTVYPVISQVVFAFAAFVTPDSASVPTQLLVMKSVIVMFDLATMRVLILLLRFAGRPAEWSIVYAWCPLVLKEFANSGHLDAIAVFFTMAALSCAVRCLFPHENDCSLDKSARSHVTPRHWLFATAVILSLGIGAKIYPIVLAPLLFLPAWRRIGRIEAVLASVVVATLTSLMIAPMLFRAQGEPALPPQPVATSPSIKSPPIPSSSSKPGGPSPPRRTGPRIDPNATGLGAFAAQWQMNDFLFLILFENLKPDTNLSWDEQKSNQLSPVTTDPPLPPRKVSAETIVSDATGNAQPAGAAPWFVVTSQESRVQFVDTVAKFASLSPKQIPFQATRLLTSGLFLLLALWWAWRGMKSNSPDDWLHAAFLTIAWFWLLQPTQNPWYWIWALPLVPFARSRAWLAMSGLTLLYYSRFWFLYHADSTPLYGTPYVGVEFFDFVVTWIEYAPWFVWLGVETLMSRWKRAPLENSTQITTA